MFPFPPEAESMRPSRVHSAWPLSLALLLLAGGLSGAGQPTRVFWQKDYSRGRTELHRIEVEMDGKTRYVLRLGDGEPVAADFQLKPRILQHLLDMFVQADFLNRDKNFVSSRRVADTGTRTIRLVSGPQKREVVFRHTDDKTFRKIVTFFDHLSAQERFLLDLKLTLKHDRLGIPRKLDLLRGFLDRKTIVDPQRFSPILKRISLDTSLMNLARKTARRLLRQIDRHPSG